MGRGNSTSEETRGCPAISVSKGHATPHRPRCTRKKPLVDCFCLTVCEQEERPEGETYFLAHLSDRYPSSSGMTDACYCAVIPSNLLSLSCACTHITLDWIGTCDSFMTISHDTGASGTSTRDSAGREVAVSVARARLRAASPEVCITAPASLHVPLPLLTPSRRAPRRNTQSRPTSNSCRFLPSPALNTQMCHTL